MIQIPHVGAPNEPFLEGWTVLAGLAAVTSRIRLVTLATAVGYRNPAHLAKIAASVDLISRGRLTLGIGAGFFEEEYRQYGWEFPPRPATRIRRMEEAVQLILKMWTEPRTTFHAGISTSKMRSSNRSRCKSRVRRRDIAWKGQVRWCARYRQLARTGKPANIVTTAIARELSGFISGSISRSW